MGVTPPEEIKRQQNEATEMVESIKCMDMIDYGEIPLEKKQKPTEEVYSHENYKEAGAVISTRGDIDVSSIADIIREGYNEPSLVNSQATATATSKPKLMKKNMSASASAGQRQRQRQSANGKLNLWDPEIARVQNVSITRPSHDAWGIKKIVLIFCDDFLQRVYEMPWWHSTSCPIAESMRQTIQPVLDALQISEKQVVRMLFAGLPPQVTIPVHHDTGYWVKMTHRVHVPIIVEDPNLILFRCGPTPSTLQRVNAKPGHIFEMNNQAKHAVSNCSTAHHRVHLILDYVPLTHTHTHTRIPLQPGETLLQTRRTIDRKADFGKTPTPTFVILGAQKAGTTSLYEYLNQHPSIVRARRRETHCLDWRWDATKKTIAEQKKHCLSFYYADQLKHYPSLQTGDSTPSYLLHTHVVIPRLKQMFPWVKCMVMLRDPVKRAISHYSMVTDTNGTPEQLKTRGFEWRNKTLMQVVQDEIQLLKEDGLIPYWNVDTNTVDQQIFDQFVGSKEEDEAWTRFQTKRIPLSTGSHSLLARGMYHLQLRHWFNAFPRDQFLVIQMESMKEPNGVENVMKKAYSFLNLQYFDVEDDSPKNSREYNPVQDDVVEVLRNFYAAHNNILSQLLDGDEWTNPWAYETTAE